MQKQLTLSPMNCATCDRPLAFHPERGWCHEDTQGQPASHIWMRCDACGWEGSIFPTPSRCPACGAGRDFRDDHCARPTYSRL